MNPRFMRSIYHVATICIVLGVFCALWSAAWFGLVLFALSLPDSIPRRLAQQYELSRTLSAGAFFALILSSMVIAGARDWRRGKREGRKVLLAAIACGHALGLIITMVQFTLLPAILRCIWPAADPYVNLVHRQNMLLLATAACWTAILMFDTWLIVAMRRLTDRGNKK